jgi:DNA-directed RNA polymerase subunit M/transcription elongation factor TFIIS
MSAKHSNLNNDHNFVVHHVREKSISRMSLQDYLNKVNNKASVREMEYIHSQLYIASGYRSFHERANNLIKALDKGNIITVISTEKIDEMLEENLRPQIEDQILVECPKCNHLSATVTFVQLHAGDEGDTGIYTCYNPKCRQGTIQ